MPTAQELSLTNVERSVFRALHPNQRDILSSLLLPPSYCLPIFFHVLLPRSSYVVLLHAVPSFYVVSPDDSQACRTRLYVYSTKVTSKKAIEGGGCVQILMSVSHSQRCCYHDRIMDSCRIT